MILLQNEDKSKWLHQSFSLTNVDAIDPNSHSTPNGAQLYHDGLVLRLCIAKVLVGLVGQHDRKRFGDLVMQMQGPACAYDLNTCGCGMFILQSEWFDLQSDEICKTKKIGYQFECYIAKGHTTLENTSVNIR